jgi:hypothetical protein
VIANGAVVQTGYTMYVLLALRPLNQTHKRAEPESGLILKLDGQSVVEGLCLELHPDLAVSEILMVLELLSYTLSTLAAAAFITP